MTNLYFIRRSKVAISCLLLLLSFVVQANRPEYKITIKNHLFYPAKVVIPANKKVKLIITNHDKTVEEFDSFNLNREKVIFPNQQAVIFIGPLDEGEYEFFGEYHPHSARGKIIVVKDIQSKDLLSKGILSKETVNGGQYVN